MRRAEKAGPRVLLVGNFLSGDGTGSRQVCEELANRLEGAGLGVIRTSSKSGRAERMGDMVATAWNRRRDYDVAQIDVFSDRSFVWAEAVAWTLRHARKPYILTLHGGDLPRFCARWPRRGRALLRSAAAVTAPSRYLVENLREYRPDLLLLPNALDLAAYEFHPRVEPRPNLLWLRSFHEVYNPVMAPRVLARLIGEFPSSRLTMIGPDKGDGSLERARAAAADLPVEFRGGVAKQDVPAALAPGEIFLNTTDFDNMPVTVVEALACGLCVVSTDVGGIPFLLEHEHDALLVPRGDDAAMAAEVRRLLREPGLAEKLSRNGRHKAAECDWAVVLPRWIELLYRTMRSR